MREKRLTQCRKDGNVAHYHAQLFVCRAGSCDQQMNYGGAVFCKLPIIEKIHKERQKEIKEYGKV